MQCFVSGGPGYQLAHVSTSLVAFFLGGPSGPMSPVGSQQPRFVEGGLGPRRRPQSLPQRQLGASFSIGARSAGGFRAWDATEVGGGPWLLATFQAGSIGFSPQVWSTFFFRILEFSLFRDWRRNLQERVSYCVHDRSAKGGCKTWYVRCFRGFASWDADDMWWEIDSDGLTGRHRPTNWAHTGTYSSDATSASLLQRCFSRIN